MLNVALFGKTAQQWKSDNRNLEGNVRDYATLEQLVVLSNMESMNSVMIHQGLAQEDRIIELNQTAIIQLKSLFYTSDIKGEFTIVVQGLTVKGLIPVFGKSDFMVNH